MITKDAFWQELSRLLGRVVTPESDLGANPAIWEALPSATKEQVNGLLAIAMHSPNLMFSDEPIAHSADELLGVELPLWKDVVPATPAGNSQVRFTRPEFRTHGNQNMNKPTMPSTFFPIFKMNNQKWVDFASFG